jgi:antimicrobial peptide system SdpB family protein
MMQRLYPWIESYSTPRHTIGFSLFRVVAGALIVLEYLLNYAQRHYLFGPDGVLSWSTFLHQKRGFSLYQLSSEAWYFELVYHVGLLLALLWVTGFRSRWVTPLNYVFWFSLQQRNPLLWDGGDNLMRLCLVYAMFADVGQHFRLFGGGSSPRPDGLWSRMQGLTHNAALLCFALQVSLVYFVAGLTKVQGETWQNGTALYYALWPDQFRFPGLSELLYENASFLVLVSHATVLFQVAFPFMLLLNRVSRRVAILMAITFHLGIAGVMGLFTFAGFMIAAELVLISNAGYGSLTATARQLLGAALSTRFRARMRVQNALVDS